MRLLFPFLFLFTFSSSAQSLTGTNGLFKVPSAFVNPDGLGYIGASFYPRGFYEYLGDGDKFVGMPTFITLSLFDRIEFMFRYTHQLGQKVNPETRYFPDRMFSLRYNVLKEGDSFPALTIGLHDVSEALGSTTAKPWFLATYIVASKLIEVNTFSINPTLGYAFDIMGSARPMIFDGVFGGVEFSSSNWPYLSLIGEYDSDMFNIALKTTLFGHLHFAVGMLNMQKPSAFFTYRFNLSSR